MYYLIFEYNKEVVTDKTIPMDWDIWDKEIRLEYSNIAGNSFGCIAAFSRIGFPVSTEFFSQFYDIKQNLLEQFLKTQYENELNTPILLSYDKGKMFISTKHDMIPDLYFYFNSRIVFDGTMSEFIEFLEDCVYKLESTNHFANWYLNSFKNSSKFSKAEEQYKKSVELSEKVLGNEHPDTATTYNNLASVYYHKGDYTKALEWHHKALTICEKVMGKEHPNTATTYNNIAGVYNKPRRLRQGTRVVPKGFRYPRKGVGQGASINCHHIQQLSYRIFSPRRLP